MNDINTVTPIAKEKKHGFHPKRALKSLQQALYSSPAGYLVFCFLIPIAISFCVYLTRALHPFGEGTPLVLDLNAQYVYFFEALKNAVLEGGCRYSRRPCGGCYNRSFNRRYQYVKEERYHQKAYGS